SMLAAAQSGGTGGARAADPTVLIVAQPVTRYPEAMFERGVTVVLADARANPLNPFEGHKTLNYWWRLRELQTAARKGAGEALVRIEGNAIGAAAGEEGRPGNVAGDLRRAWLEFLPGGKGRG